MVLRGKESQAVGVYLTDLNHHREVRRRFCEVVEEYGKDRIMSILKKLPCSREEKDYLRKRVWRVLAI